jgi:hypothetical protein
MAHYSFQQTEPQSCTAASIMVTLAELGKIPATDIKQTKEMEIWGLTKRGNVKGQEEVMPHKAINYLTSQGLVTELHQNKTITDGLKKAAAHDYAEYKQGLKDEKITRSGELNLTTAFAKDARVFLIVGFMEANALKTHTILVRKDGGKLWVMNPDGGSDTEYADAKVLAFIGGQKTPVNFAGRNYLCAGIAYRAWIP